MASPWATRTGMTQPTAGAQFRQTLLTASTMKQKPMLALLDTLAPILTV